MRPAAAAPQNAWRDAKRHPRDAGATVGNEVFAEWMNIVCARDCQQPEDENEQEDDFEPCFSEQVALVACPDLRHD
jgi:hypothetical protein